MNKYHNQSIMGILFSSEAQDSYHSESTGPEQLYGSDFLTPGKWGEVLTSRKKSSLCFSIENILQRHRSRERNLRSCRQRLVEQKPPSLQCGFLTTSPSLLCPSPWVLWPQSRTRDFLL